MNAIQILKLFIAASLAGTLLIGVLFMMRTSDEDEMRLYAKQVVYDHKKSPANENRNIDAVKVTRPATARTPEPKRKSSRRASAQIFYYPWYGSPEFDNNRYYHWNHPLLKPNPESKMKPTNHTPPNDIASIFYPQLGPYSSRNQTVIEQHMKWMASAGIDVVVVSWYPAGKSDGQGYPWDDLIPASFHLEPYPNQTAASVRKDIEYVISKYGQFPAFYRAYPKHDTPKPLPLFYVYDSYKIPYDDWAKLATVNGSMSIRDTEFDSILIGLVLKVNDIHMMSSSGFNGVYTYFAADGFTEASSMENWKRMSELCEEKSLLFAPSVGPGYDDTRVRPWNYKNIRSRKDGSYYQEHLKAAHTAKADILSITSFNEWHEGTNIEPAIPFRDDNGTGYVYQNYEKDPDFYLQLTHEAIHKLFTPEHEKISNNLAKII
ncbi:hypothetical protein M3Y97_00355500 [Aphelenchoides bicaudatus]|nr:hypothetical protein M3Y97_00355500 [Aphelenchoides bicaudatus]